MPSELKYSVLIQPLTENFHWGNESFVAFGTKGKEYFLPNISSLEYLVSKLEFSKFERKKEREREERKHFGW